MSDKVSFDRRTLPLTITICLLLATCSMALAQTEASTTCQAIQVPMCRGMIAYNTTTLPNMFGHTNQTQVYWALQPWWPFVDSGCSDNLRNFLCAMFLPKCFGDNSEPMYPCLETCKKAKVRCKKLMRMQSFKWSKDFKCGKLLPKDSHKCIKPAREGKKKQNKEYVLCQKNYFPVCQGLPYSLGSLPNIFLQGDTNEIAKELNQYQKLIDSKCSAKLKFFLCGTYMPYCLDKLGAALKEKAAVDGLTDTENKLPFVVPCRELCQEVYNQCSSVHQQLTEGLPWPAKLQCHRFPSATDFYYMNRTLVNTNGNGEKMPCFL